LTYICASAQVRFVPGGLNQQVRGIQAVLLHYRRANSWLDYQTGNLNLQSPLSSMSGIVCKTVIPSRVEERQLWPNYGRSADAFQAAQGRAGFIMGYLGLRTGEIALGPQPSTCTCTKHQAPSTKHQASSIKHQASSIKHQASSTKHQASSTKHQASSIKHQASSINLRATGGGRLPLHGNCQTEQGSEQEFERREVPPDLVPRAF